MKRRLGDTTPIVVSGQPYGSEALIAQLLGAVIERSTTQLGAAPAELALTHPANWGEYKLDLAREIARLAGREDATLIAEPVAAALHYASLGKLSPGDTVAVYDFGGGTFDVAVVRCHEDGAELLGTPGGLERLGGVDLDQIVLVHVDGALDGKLRELDTTQADVRAAIAQLRASCTSAKEALSADTDAVVPVHLGDLHTDVRITRSEFESAVRARVDDTLGALDRALASAEVDAGALAGILLVGGSSRIPSVVELVGSHTGRPVLVDADAKAVVALGAASGGALASATVVMAGAAAGAEGAGGAPRSARAGAAAVGSGGRARDERGSAATRVVAGVAGVAAAAGVTAAGVYGYNQLTDDGGGSSDADADAGEAGSMDVFDEIADTAGAALGDAAATAGDLAAFAAAGAGAGGAAVDLGFSDTPAGRITSRVFAAAPGAGAADVASAPRAPGGSGGSGGSGAGGGSGTREAQDAPGSLFSDPGVEAVRDQLRERLAAFKAPEGADPAEVADLQADLAELLDRFHGYPGQAVDDAVASLRYQFEDRVRDFAQDQKLDALIKDEETERAEEAALDQEVDGFREDLRERLTSWQAPDGADPAAVAAMRADLEGMLERFTPIPGQSADDALADLRGRFNDRVRDFAQDQKLEAVVDELAVEETPATGEATEPETTEPETTEPGAETTEPETTEPETGTIEGAEPGTETPETEAPETETPDTEAPVAAEAATTSASALQDTFEDVISGADATAQVDVGMVTDSVLGDPPPPGVEESLVQSEAVAAAAGLGDDVLGTVHMDQELATAAAAEAASVIADATADTVDMVTIPDLDEIPGLDTEDALADPLGADLDATLVDASPTTESLEGLADSASLPDLDADAADQPDDDVLL